MSLAAPQLRRFFASSSRFGQRSSYDDEDTYQGRGQSRYHNEDGDNERVSSPMERQVVPFEANLFQQFHSLKEKELSAYIGSATTDNIGTEAYLTRFSDSLRTREAKIAFKELSPEQRIQFVKNIFFLLNEANRSRNRFPSFSLLSFVFDNCIRLGDPAPMLEIFESLKTITTNESFIRGTLNCFFNDLERRRLTHGVYRIREVFPVAEKMYTYCIQQTPPTYNNQVTRRNFNSMAAYLSCAASGAFPVDSINFRTIRSHFLGEDFANGSPGGGVLAYAAIASSIRTFPGLIIENESVIDSLNEYIRVVNEESRTRRKFDSSRENEGDEASEAETEKISSIVAGERVRAEQLFTAVQSMVIAESTGIPSIVNVLDHLVNNIPATAIHYRFRKWLTQHIRGLDLNRVSHSNLLIYMRAVARFVSPKRFPDLHVLIIKAIAAKMDRYKGSQGHAHLLLAISPAYSEATATKEEAKDGEPEMSAYVKQEMKEEDKQAVKDMYGQLLESVLKEEIFYGFNDNLNLLYHLLKYDNSFTVEDIKKKAIHRNTWEQMSKRNSISNDATRVFKVLSCYNLLEDEEMMKVLVLALEKAENKGNPNNASAEVFNKNFHFLNLIHQAFEEKADKLTGYQTVAFEKINAFRSKQRKVGNRDRS